MGSRRFFCLLPLPGNRLDFSVITSMLSGGGMTFDTRAFVFDGFEDGMPITPHQEQLDRPSHQRFLELAGRSAYAEVMCRDRHLSLTLSLGSPHAAPIAMISVSRKLLSALDPTARGRYEQLLVDIAEASGATNVVVIDDPPDDFFAGLEPIADRWMIDIRLPRGGVLDPCAVLVSRSRGKWPVTPELRPTGKTVGAFDELVPYKDAGTPTLG